MCWLRRIEPFATLALSIGEGDRLFIPRPWLPKEKGGQRGAGLSFTDALLLCELLAKVDPARYEKAALRWLQRFIVERSPPLTEVSLAASALAELRHGRGSVGVEALKRLLRSG